jgi:hypothetical protein
MATVQLTVFILACLFLIQVPYLQAASVVPANLGVSSASPVSAGDQPTDIFVAFTNASKAPIRTSAFVVDHGALLQVVIMGSDLDTFSHVQLSRPENYGLNSSAAGELTIMHAIPIIVYSLSRCCIHIHIVPIVGP